MKIEIEISVQAYQAITEQTHDVSAFVEAVALQREKSTAPKQRFNPDEVLAGFKKLEGMFGDATLEEVLSDRRCGLE